MYTLDVYLHVSQDSQSKMKNPLHMFNLQRCRSDIDAREPAMLLGNQGVMGTGLFRGATDMDKLVSMGSFV